MIQVLHYELLENQHLPLVLHRVVMNSTLREVPHENIDDFCSFACFKEPNTESESGGGFGPGLTQNSLIDYAKINSVPPGPDIITSIDMNQNHHEKTILGGKPAG